MRKRIILIAAVLVVPGAWAFLIMRALRRRRLHRQIDRLALTAQPNIAKVGTFGHYNTGRTASVH